MENNELVPVNNQALIDLNEARVNVTYAGSNGDLPDPVNFQANEADIKTWITEALRNGSIPGIVAQGNVDLRDFVVDRFAATEARPYNLIQLRPKTPFGMAPDPRAQQGYHRFGATAPTTTGEYFCRDCGQHIQLHAQGQLCPARPRSST